MKRRITSLALALCMLLCLLPVTVLAEDENTQWKYQETPTEVTTYDALKEVLHSGEAEPDNNNIIWIPVAKLTESLELTSGQDIRTLGKLIIPSGVTLTVNSYFEAETEIQSGGAVIVKNGGYFGTTMGGDMKNSGTITVNEGGVMQSTMGASIVNKSGGTIALNGTFYCGSVNYDNADHLWFANEAESSAISGNGDIIVYDAGAGDEGRDTVDLDAMIGNVMDILGQSKRFENWNDINIFKQVEVASYRALAALFNASRTIKGEAVEGNMDTIIVLNGNVTVPEDAALSGMVQVIVSSGVTLTVEGSLEAGVVIEGEGEGWDEETGAEINLNPAEVVVKPFGKLATTMGGKIENYGKLTVYSSGTIESQMGGEIENHATFILDGLCYVGGYYNVKENHRGEWFSSDSSATITGSGHIIVKPVVVQRENTDNEADDAEIRIAATTALKANLTGSNSVSVYTTATSFEDIKALNNSDAVDGIYLNGTSDESNGIHMMNISDESKKAVGEIHVTEDISISKKLCIDWADLIVDKDKTLTISNFDNLSFVGRRTRIVVEAPALGDTAGGTLAIGNAKVISGDSAQNAVFTVTGNIMALGAAEWAVFDYPAAAKSGAWYYVHNDNGAVNAAGTLANDTALPLLVDGTLNITGDFTHPGSVEIRNGLTVAADATVSIGDIDYGTESKESNAVVKGKNSTTYELEFDLNTGNGYEDIFDHLDYSNDGKIYLQADGNEIPVTPTRSGYTFRGWTATSGWTNAATSEKLAAFTVTVDGDEAWIPVPTDFPVVMVAQWRSNSTSPSTPNTPSTPSTPAETTETIPVSGDDDSINVTVKVSGDTATITSADMDKVLETEDVGTVTIDVSALKEDVSEIVIPSAMVEKIADAVADEESNAVGLEIKLPIGTVTFDADAVATIAEQTDGKDLSLNLEDVKVTELSTEQQEAVKELDVEIVLDAYLTSNGERISDFGGGKATVSVPYELKDGQIAQGLVVWYVADDGAKTQIPATYDGKNIVFTVSHFSNYVVAYDAEKATACPQDDTCPMSAFTDLNPALWYHDGIHYCLENGMMNGVGNNQFNPGGTTSRGMIVTILYRLENEPEVTSENPFDDVEADKWYTDAVIWAAENKIVDGYGNGKFGPNDDITREQLAAILYRYAQFKGIDVSVGEDTNILSFPDATEVSGWATASVQWAVGSGIINGKDGKLVPKGDASRAEAATMIQRFSTLSIEGA